MRDPELVEDASVGLADRLGQMFVIPMFLSSDAFSSDASMCVPIATTARSNSWMPSWRSASSLVLSARTAWVI